MKKQRIQIKKRIIWKINPITRVVPSKKLYKRIRQTEYYYER